jgi:hypothetical protein
MVGRVHKEELNRVDMWYDPARPQLLRWGMRTSADRARVWFF